MPVEHQKEATKGKRRLKYQWQDRAELADQHKGFFVYIYALLCAHSHSSYLSILQLAKAENQDDQRDLTGMYTHVGLLLMTHFLKNYCAHFKEAQQVLDQNEEYGRLVEINHLTASDMDSFYRNFESPPLE